jgi:hypothetical protein
MMLFQVDPMATLETGGRDLARTQNALKQRKNTLSWYPTQPPRPWRGAVTRLLKLLRVALLIAVLSLDIYLSVKVIPLLYRASFPHHTQITNGQFMKIKFSPLPDRMTVRVLLVPQSEQRYDTLGDWIWTGTGLEIRLSREFCERDPRYGALLLVHEFVEAMLCRSTGISTRQVDAFDMRFVGDGEPGDDPSAPYHYQHQAAEAAERALAAELGVNWRRYMRS